MNVFDINRSVPGLIGVFESLYTQASTQMLRREFGVSLAEARIILLVGAEPGIPGLRVSKVFGIDRALVSRSLRTLVAKRLLDVGRDTRHARRQNLQLTETGRALHDAIVCLSMKREAILLSDFSPSDRDMLLAMLTKLLQGIPAANEFAVKV